MPTGATWKAGRGVVDAEGAMWMTTAAARVTIAAMSERDVEFEAYATARRRRLLRTAYLLTGDQHSAEDLLQSALAKLYLSWDKVSDGRPSTAMSAASW
jgi:DNA-directed RNA polymerase specialized sigma24 family protein